MTDIMALIAVPGAPDMGNEIFMRYWSRLVELTSTQQTGWS